MKCLPHLITSCLLMASTGMYAQIQAGSTNLLKYSSTGLYNSAQVGTAENIGIGTPSSSVFKLYVRAAPTGSAVTRVENNSTSTSTSSIALEGLHSTGVAVAGNSASGWAGYFTGKMYVSNRIGIGTTTPNYRLELQNTGATGTSRNIMLRLTNGWNSTGANMPTIQFHNGEPIGGTNEYYWNVGAAVASSLRFAISYKSPGLSSETEFFTINPEGKVSIGGAGTVSNDYCLFVQKGIQTCRIKSEVSLCDFVFEDGYALTPLKEVKTFVETYHHLPGVISVTEAEEAGGVELGQFTSSLQQKIEDLYLYMFEMEAEIDRLQQELSTLKGASHSSDNKK